mgnify:FL=1|jgi:hypothetical protein
MSVINAIATALITNIKPGTPSEYQQLVPVGLWVDYSLLNAESLTQKKQPVTSVALKIIHLPA